MYKGHRNRLLEKDRTNKMLNSLAQVSKCNKCNKLNNILYSPAYNNINVCIYCGNPFYIIK